MDPRRRRGARRTALLLAVIVLALYFGFIAYALVRGLHAGRRGSAHTAAPAAGTTPGAPRAPSTDR
ncbi:MAG TPA: hypothetical protein VMD56_11340 [Steroidobacteraceae bacterium]|nr:hypothetical protein [Steroidobacteraceae bacterium]